MPGANRRPAQAPLGPGSGAGRDRQGYARHESSTLENVVQARSQATQAGSLTERGASERGLLTAVGRLFALAEAYPELKASQNFQELQKSLVE